MFKTIATFAALATLAAATFAPAHAGNDGWVNGVSLNGKELLDISYGSVLPLERVIGEPVDLVLENKTIAQAEVVLINGKN
ncbi:MAG: FliM/FliN family flagellar motor switch protein, partial [Rhodospirillales bacterium]|nr:FliM/FliN family flagellar motor switch protein [Rhodospirillales bacterium]